MKVLYKVLTSGILVLSLTGCRIDELEGLVDSYAGAGLFDPQLRWSAQQYDITIGETGSFPSLTNEYGVNVTYTSSDENVASIADNGEITILAVQSRIKTIVDFHSKNLGMDPTKGLGYWVSDVPAISIELSINNAEARLPNGKYFTNRFEIRNCLDAISHTLSSTSSQAKKERQI